MFTLRFTDYFALIGAIIEKKDEIDTHLFNSIELISDIMATSTYMYVRTCKLVSK